ncbi:MAG: hypothetical protein QXF12_00615 [Candidatus Aenigmatarchaeota archaeon]
MILLYQPENIIFISKTKYFLHRVKLNENLANKLFRKFTLCYSYDKTLSNLQTNFGFYVYTSKRNLDYDKLHIIFLGNHGYSRKMDLIFSFYFDYSENTYKSTNYVFSVLSYYEDDTPSAILHLIVSYQWLKKPNYNEALNFIYEVKINKANDSKIANILLSNINASKRESVNLKQYFVNYKNYLIDTYKSFLVHNRNLYLYKFSNSSVVGEIDSCKKSFCREITTADSMQKIIYDSLDNRYEFTKKFREIVVLTKARIIMTFIDNLRSKINLKYFYVLEKKNEVVIIDEVRGIYKLDNTRSKVIKDLFYLYTFKQIKEKPYNLFREKINDYYYVNDVLDKDFYIKKYNQNKIEVFAVVEEMGGFTNKNAYSINRAFDFYLLENINAILYAFLDDGNFVCIEISNLFISIKILLEFSKVREFLYKNVHKPNLPFINMRGSHDTYYFENIPTHLIGFLLGESSIKRINKLIKDQLLDRPMKIFEYTHRYKQNDSIMQLIEYTKNNNPELITKYKSFFAGPYDMNIDLRHLNIKASDLPIDVSRIIMEVKKRNKIYYLFSVYLEKYIIITGNKNDSQKIDKYIIINTEETYLEEVSASNTKINIRLSFAIEKSEWDKIKCSDLYLHKIVGRFYVHNHYDYKVGGNQKLYFDIICFEESHKVFFMK